MEDVPALAVAFRLMFVSCPFVIHTPPPSSQHADASLPMPQQKLPWSHGVNGTVLTVPLIA